MPLSYRDFILQSKEENAIALAKEGSFGVLVWMLRDKSAELSPEIRELLANILEGKLKLSAHRPKRLKREIRYSAMGYCVESLERQGWKRTAAVRVAAWGFQCTERTVQTALAYREKTFGEWLRSSRAQGQLVESVHSAGADETN